MALEHLLAALERDTERHVASLRDEAERRAAAILQEAEADAADQLAAFERRRRAALAAGTDAEVAEAREDAIRRRLEARAELLGRVFARARDLLDTAAASETAHDVLVEQAREAVSFLGGTAAVLRCPPGLAASLGNVFPAGTSVEIRPDPETPAGFTVSTADGHLTVDGTLAARLERLRPVLAVELAARAETGT